MIDGWIPSQLKLEYEGWEFMLSPETGGVITACRYDGRDILRPATKQWHHTLNPMQASCYPLFPYSNRIAGGDMQFGGETHHLDVNIATIAHPIHGTSWFGHWDVKSKSKTACSIEYVQPRTDGAWPYAFRAQQKFKIIKNELHIDLSIQNLDTRPMPTGMGLHPYFHKQGAHLQFKANGVWLAGEDCLPKTWSETIPKWDFSDSHPIEPVALDHCFTGWDGVARISWDDREQLVNIRADDVMGHAVVYTGEAESFCFEPVSHMNNAVQWMDQRSDTGICVLAPSETLTSRLVLSVSK